MPVTTLSEPDSKARLRPFGIPFPLEETAGSAEEAARAAAALGFPVAVKLTGPGLSHKSERGLVRLGLESPGAVAAAAAGLLADARPEDGPVRLLVARMVSGRRELIAGLHRDPIFGMAVMLGIGGVLAEAVEEVVFRLVPLTPDDARDMIDDLRAERFLGAFRGDPPADRAALAAILLALSTAAESDHRIASVDLNPIILEGSDPVAVDALVELLEEPVG